MSKKVPISYLLEISSSITVFFFIFLTLSFFRLGIFKVYFSTKGCNLSHLSKCQHFLLPSWCISARFAASPQQLLLVIGVRGWAEKMEFCHPVGAAGPWRRGREESGTLSAVKARYSCSWDAVEMSRMSLSSICRSVNKSASWKPMPLSGTYSYTFKKRLKINLTSENLFKCPWKIVGKY